MRGVATVCLVALVSVAQEVPDPRFPRTLEEWTPASLLNAEELGNLFEFDIEPPLPSWEKSGLIDEKYRWPGAMVPYQIDHGFSQHDVNLLEYAMKEFERRTNNCIKWVLRSEEADYVKFIQTEEKCSSRMGMKGGMQPLYLASKCFVEIGTVMHEMMHALGVVHEHDRNDRDEFITIMWQNIRPDVLNNFKKFSSRVVDPFGVPYNYGSVMHYGAYVGSSNQQKTIVTKDPNAVIGQRDDLTDEDIRKVMNMYKC